MPAIQPETAIHLNEPAFNRLRRSVGLKSRALRERARDPGYAAPVPEEIGIQLTYACNLRCAHCFQWNETGFFHDFAPDKQGQDLSVDVFDRLLRATAEQRSELFIWGGEPLVHRDWEAVAGLIERDPRWTVMCTNGLLLEKKAESILRISENLALLVSVDGLEDHNDSIRGRNTFKRTIGNLRTFLDLQRKGEYKGEISVNCVLSDAVAPRLLDILEYFEELGINTMYFGFPWYIAPETAERMDAFYEEHFSWLRPLPEGTKPSWHSYNFHLSPDSMEILREQLARVNERRWNIRVRFQPNLEHEELNDFLTGSSRPGQQRRHCLAVSNRLDVQADGTAGPCKLFPEFGIGNLNEEEVLDVWRHEDFRRLRQIIAGGLMPVCSKCILLYLNGI